MRKAFLFSVFCMTMILFLACTQVQVKKDEKIEFLVKKGLIPDFSVKPESTQKKTVGGVTVEINYEGVMKPEQYKCLDKKQDDSITRLLFTFVMKNENKENIKYTEPYIVFKGSRVDDACELIRSSGPVNIVQAIRGKSYELLMGSQEVKKTAFKILELESEEEMAGILIVSPPSAREMNPGEQVDQAPKTYPIRGSIVFSEPTEAGKRKQKMKFDYTFIPQFVYGDVQYKKVTPYTYKVNVRREGDKDIEEKIQNSEEYGTPEQQMIGPVPKRK